MDLAVVGAGLSGARAVIELVHVLDAHRHPLSRPLRVALIDPAPDHGRGVPYGNRSDRRALLIETLAQTRCPEFSRWIGEHRVLLAEMQHSQDTDDRAWHRRNAAAVAAGDLADLYLPRHVFGAFSESSLEDALALGRRNGLLTVTSHCAEVVEIEPSAGGSYGLRCSDGTSMECGAVLIAVGSIPRGDGFLPTLGQPLAHRYITDQAYCGSFQLRDAFDLYQSRESAGPVRLAIIGAAASAIESLYCVVNHPPLSQRIESITTISRSGMLPGGITGNRSVIASDYAIRRTSADVYVQTARELLARGHLDIVPARVGSIEAVPGALRLELIDTLDGQRTQTEFDLIINCSGAGDVQTSRSRLLNFLGQRLEVRRQGRGFRTNGDHSLAQWPRVFLAGPLLNGGDAGSDVESISAVFKVGRELGQALAASLTGSGAGMATAPRSAQGT
ncbi:MAG TPA: FAD/NAD(P)-binding protein [Steroidobacteraceae bacterium]|nr:FAD/NAD(P)-binding protein [Steroidobacteraceae bacterium]